MRFFILGFSVAVSLAATIVGATAGSRAYYYPQDEFYAPPAPAAFLFTRHSARCEYPRGFNQTDFIKSINGTPRDSSELLETGCASPTPFPF